MKFLFIIILALSAQAADYKDPDTCSEWKPSDYDKFIDYYMTDPSYFSYLSERPMETVMGNYTYMYERCSDYIDQLGISGCFTRFVGYVGQFAGPGKRGMFSSIMTDEEYYASQPQELMQLPPEIANSPSGLPKNWREIAEQNGWQWVYFSSNTADQSRVVMRLPGEKYDRLLVFYATDPGITDPTKFNGGVQMQVIEKDPPEGQKAKYYFRSWQFTGSGGRPNLSVSGGRCIQCHINGPRAVIPKESWKARIKTEVGGVASVKEFNKLIGSHEELDYSPFYNHDYFPSRLELGDKNGCTECHGGGKNQRNSFAYGVDSGGQFYFGNWYRKVYIEKSMPQEDYNIMSNGERERYHYTIGREYATAMSNWLTETKCEKLAKTNTPPTPSNDDSKPLYKRIFDAITQ